MPPRFCSGPSHVSLAVQRYFQRNADIRVRRITGDIGPCSHKVSRHRCRIHDLPRRVLRIPPRRVVAVIDAVEVNWLASVVGPPAVRRRGQPDHLGKRCPSSQCATSFHRISPRQGCAEGHHNQAGARAKTTFKTLNPSRRGKGEVPASG